MIRLCSSNIRFDNPADVEFPWFKRKKVLSSLINKFSPHMLGTQEGRRPQLMELAENLKDLKLIEGHREWLEERMYPCLFFNDQYFEMVGSGDFWLSKTPNVPGSKSFESAFPRLCTWSKVISKLDNKTYLFANCHLDHIRPTTRVGQIQVLMKELKELWDFDLELLVLMGDFNEGPFQEVRKKLSENLSQVYDPWTNLNLPESPSHHGFKEETPQAKRIDWILIDKRLSAKNMFLEKRSEDKIYPSDHYPVMLEFLL